MKVKATKRQAHRDAEGEGVMGPATSVTDGDCKAFFLASPFFADERAEAVLDKARQ